MLSTSAMGCLQPLLMAYAAGYYWHACCLRRSGLSGLAAGHASYFASELWRSLAVSSRSLARITNLAGSPQELTLFSFVHLVVHPDGVISLLWREVHWASGGLDGYMGCAGRKRRFDSPMWLLDKRFVTSYTLSACPLCLTSIAISFSRRRQARPLSPKPHHARPPGPGPHFLLSHRRCMSRLPCSRDWDDSKCV